MQHTIAFFPEAAFGPALNSIAIAQAVERIGHKAVFLSDPSFIEVYQGYGFEAHAVSLSAPMPAEQQGKFWNDFVDGHLANFRKSAYEQVDTYVKECWTAIVDSARWAQADLPGVLARVKPDLICVDNTILFPAIKQHGVPWVRIVSCSENEIGDPAIPPFLSGCAAHDVAAHQRFRHHLADAIGPLHAEFNTFLAEHGEAPYPFGQFFEASPYLNVLLYPEAVRFERAQPLPAERFLYLEGCVRQEKPYPLPAFERNEGDPLVYLSFGSLGSGDVPLMRQLIDALGRFPCRALVNVGAYKAQYTDLPGNVHIDSWFPQPSVIPQVDVVIHHGGNNSFTECLLFGKPAVVMPFAWDGHDNAMRAHETGHGLRLTRGDWTEAALHDALRTCLTDAAMHERMRRTSEQMKARNGPASAASALNDLLNKTTPA